MDGVYDTTPHWKRHESKPELAIDCIPREMSGPWNQYSATAHKNHATGFLLIIGFIWRHGSASAKLVS